MGIQQENMSSVGHGDVRDVDGSDLVRPVDDHVLEQIWLMYWAEPRELRFLLGADGLDAHELHESA